MLLRARAGPGTGKAPLVPGFVLGFGALMVTGSLGWLPDGVIAPGLEVSRWCLVTAIAALGMKTDLKQLVAVGWKPSALIVGNTLLMAALAVGWLMLSA